MLLGHCGENALSKVRHYVPHGTLVWEIDEYEGMLKGVVLAEVELTSMDQPITPPGWIGREVTSDEQFRKGNMLRARQRAAEQEVA